MEAVDPSRHEVTNAALETTWNFSWMISAQVGGWLIERYGFTTPILITVVFYLVSSSLYLTFFHDYERKHLTDRERPPEPVGAAP
jgi:predicted MFS family arabinose efflux permease